jgi:hypothetical protein
MMFLSVQICGKKSVEVISYLILSLFKALCEYLNSVLAPGFAGQKLPLIFEYYPNRLP